MMQGKSELLAHESAEWHNRGLISAAMSAQLGRRYDRKRATYSSLITWLALGAMCLLSAAVLAIVVLSSQSVTLGGIILGAAAVALWYCGTRMASDPLKRHPVTGSALVTVGLTAAYGAMTLLTLSIGDSLSDTRFPALLTVTAVFGMATAYRYHLRWPLLLSLLCFFHGLGAWHGYAGDGAYVANIQDPRTMAVIAALCAIFGLWHQHAEEGWLRRLVGFGRLYVIFGLLYLDCSLWFLSLASYGDAHILRWVLLFSATCVAQIVAGARLKDGKLTGFGIVFLSIDLYTRFFEHFWGRLSIGLSLLIAGLSAVVLGWLFEKRAGAATA